MRIHYTSPETGFPGVRSKQTKFGGEGEYFGGDFPALYCLHHPQHTTHTYAIRFKSRIDPLYFTYILVIIGL